MYNTVSHDPGVLSNRFKLGFAAVVRHRRSVVTTASSAAAPFARQLQPEAPVDASNVEQSMASVPTNYTFPCNTQISLCPHVWRGIAAPCGVMVNLGLQLTEVAGEQSFLMGMYHCINPRIVTTGMPSRSRHHQPSRHHTEVPSGTTTRAAAASNRPPRAAPPPARCPSSENVRKDKDAYTIEEVWMLKRDKSTHKVEATWHCRGPLEGGTVPQIPKWPGICKIDILARVCSGANDSIWLKAPYRHVPANYEDL
ncbi:hypothetical protein WJX72_001372 [[Myrmecia] bisecta]|uniref:Uncharacterized protein n=1 Tax=[Myrmecia] bisecta TaxID=41462 RepID=A0AAW1PT45_9CHLO